MIKKKKAGPKIILGHLVKLKATQVHRSRKFYNRKKEKVNARSLVNELN